MEHQIHVQIMGENQRKNLLTTNANATHATSLTTLSVKKDSVLHHHDQNISLGNVRSDNIIHTTIWTSRGKISPTDIQLTDHKSEKTIRTGKAVKSMKDTIKPLNVTKRQRHRKSVEKVFLTRYSFFVRYLVC